ncbi:hypothetical protein IHE45_10G033700 [Dioscorea alata]|uniref:Uncharacterized protein n=1 Tax=Dioscorea alata TaxID=55571 RepID=A0ACB7VAA6_DIOAL|nr:hypothetical protein IHE45_10G033700 [Dioscorea alata]
MCTVVLAFLLRRMVRLLARLNMYERWWTEITTCIVSNSPVRHRERKGEITKERKEVAHAGFYHACTCIFSL